MTLSLRQRALALTLCLVVLMTGCVTSLRSQHNRDVAPIASAEVETEAGPQAQQVGGARNTALVFFGVVVVFLVIADVFLLPGYHRRSNYFPCTRFVYRSCYHW